MLHGRDLGSLEKPQERQKQAEGKCMPHPRCIFSYDQEFRDMLDNIYFFMHTPLTTQNVCSVQSNK